MKRSDSVLSSKDLKKSSGGRTWLSVTLSRLRNNVFLLYIDVSRT